MKQTIKYLAALVLMLCCFNAFMACSDDDDAGAPEITGVRITNPAYADSLFTASAPDSLIVIIGRNLGNAQRVYINDQQVWFNSVFNTDHSIIVKIPSEADGFELTAFNSELKDEIRVETRGGVATYAFKIKAPRPSISRLQASYPRQQGDVVNVYGLNLVDIQKAYITDIPAAQLDSTVWKEIGGNHVEVSAVQTVVKDHHLNTTTNAYETTSQVSFTMPDINFKEGAFVLECAGGTTYIPFSVLPGLPVILGVSNDMPQVGETLVITGRDFVQVESISYGDVTVSGDDLYVSESEDTISVKFTQKPTRGSATTLSVTTPGGTSSTPRFYDYTTLLTTFDGDAIDNGWSPNADYDDDDTPDGVYAHIYVPQEGQQWWGTMVFFRKDWEGGDGNVFPLPSYDVIPATASTDDVYFAANVLSHSDFNNGSYWGYLRLWLPNKTESGTDPVSGVNMYEYGFDWEDYDAQIGKFERPVLCDINGQAPTGIWYRHALPLSVFSKFAGKTYADVVADGIHQFRIQSTNQSTSRGKVDVSIDNVRIIYVPKK